MKKLFDLLASLIFAIPAALIIGAIGAFVVVGYKLVLNWLGF